MFTTQKRLIHSIDFDNAMFFLTRVSVWKNGVQINEGGCVDGFNEKEVVVNGELYHRHEFEFHVQPIQNAG